MQLHLHSDKKVKEVKHEFSEHFPYLNLEFYLTKHDQGSQPDYESEVGNNHTLSQVNANLKDASFSFEPTMTVAAFEDAMQEQYGLPVQVFRKMGDVWIETDETDDLTLEQQNLMGKASAV